MHMKGVREQLCGARYSTDAQPTASMVSEAIASVHMGPLGHVDCPKCNTTSDGTCCVSDVPEQDSADPELALPGSKRRV